MKEQISALMDGELDQGAAGEAIDALRGEGEALETWRAYHLISDGMRDTRLLSAGFTARLEARLGAEPTVLAPGPLSLDRLPGRTPAQRIAFAAAASFAAVGLVGWLAFGPQPQAPQPVAQADAPATPITVPISSAANDYLLAHQGFSPRVSLQGMVPYVRTVAERPGEPAK